MNNILKVYSSLMLIIERGTFPRANLQGLEEFRDTGPPEGSREAHHGQADAPTRLGVQLQIQPRLGHQ